MSAEPRPADGDDDHEATHTATADCQDCDFREQFESRFEHSVDDLATDAGLQHSRELGHRVEVSTVGSARNISIRGVQSDE